MKKVFVTGGSGFLGARAVRCFSALGWEVWAPGHNALELTDAACVQRSLEAFSPDLAVHCAAISSTGYAQQHPEESYAINVKASENLARVCAAQRCKLVYMSSDQVYNGCTREGPLCEEDALLPESVYGRHKLEAEQRISALCPAAVGLRLTWMYDVPAQGLPASTNLLCSLLHAALHGSPLSFATRETRGVTWAWALARALPALADVPGGVYNAGCAGTQSSYELALFAASALGCSQPKSFVLPDAQRYPSHPRNLSMSCAKLEKAGVCFPESTDGIQACLRACGWPG